MCFIFLDELKKKKKSETKMCWKGFRTHTFLCIALKQHRNEPDGDLSGPEHGNVSVGSTFVMNPGV